MNRDLIRNLKATAKHLVTWLCLVSQVTMGLAAAAPPGRSSAAPSDNAQPTTVTSSAAEIAPTVHVNRTIPDVHPPRIGLEFSANPTADEFFRARVFEEPLVPVGGEPTAAENRALAVALLGYSKRSGPDDFSSLTGYLKIHPQSPWTAALLTDLGLEYYNTAHYSLALEAWGKAWAQARNAKDAKGKAVADRAVGELAYMYARLGRMTELDALLSSVSGRAFTGPATERISGARQGLTNMKQNPGIAFRCGPLALHRIKLSLNPINAGDAIIFGSASTQKGFSLVQVADLSQRVGLDYQMAYREKNSAFVVPSVVHWKVGHYAAMVREEGGRYLLQDPTFQNDVWVTKDALETETSGYFLVHCGDLAAGWRTVAATEGQTIWGKGNVCCNDPRPNTPCDKKKDDGSCKDSSLPMVIGSAGGGGGGGGGGGCGGMAVASVHLMLVSLNIRDEPVGYSPPVGPPVRFTVTYNQREAFQPATFTYSNLGSKWTFDWLAYITDNPLSLSSDVNYYVMGGGTRTFTGFDTNTQSFGFQQYDQTRLIRTSPSSYEMQFSDGWKKTFSQSDGAIGTSRKIFLTQVSDAAGNTVTLTYDGNLRVVALTDAIGQVTTLTYGNTNDIYKITRVTDPFGRFATFGYDAANRLSTITDVLGLTSQFTYESSGDFINSLITPYGTNSFTKGENGTTRWLETLYPDGDRDRVEFNQSETVGIPGSDPVSSVPTGMATHNNYLFYRNTYYWSKIATATAYGDYTKARIYHWLHTGDGTSASGILESTKKALEGRVWNDYAGQSDSILVGTNNKPSHVGRVLDDGTTQLYTYQYNGFGKVIQAIDPVGRTMSYIYSTNGIDLLETRMTRGGASELLSQATYNAQHLPLTDKDAAGQTTTYTYNPRGQRLTETNPRGGQIIYAYDANGYLISGDGALPGADDTVTFSYDSFGRIRTKTDVSSYTLTFDYDALDNITKITHPDATFEQFTYTFLDPTMIQDRAGRRTLLEYNRIRQMSKRTDPLNRVTRYQWCKCGDSKSIVDALGRSTTWIHDVQGRVSEKHFPDGTKISYIYENASGRLHQRIDEKLQVTQYGYNPDDSGSSMSYTNAVVPTPTVTFTYDTNYARVATMTDGIGTTLYSYVPIAAAPSLGAGKLAGVSGPLPGQTANYGYDVMGRRVSTIIDGVAATLALDISGRIIAETNALGTFNYTYDGASRRLASQDSPNGQTAQMNYGNSQQDNLLQQTTFRFGSIPLETFIYSQDVPAGRIASWSQQADAQPASVYGLTYDDANQLTAASLSQGTNSPTNFSYTYDPASNRLTEQVGALTQQASYNALNELTTQTGDGRPSATYQWDAENRLVSIASGITNTLFGYDGQGRCLSIRLLVNGAEVSTRAFVWSESEICAELATNGTVSKRFFEQGVKLETGATAGSFYYTRDHLGSIHELTDSTGALRARYSYDPFGRSTRLLGDVDADFGFAGMLCTTESGLNLTRYRAYDPNVGRWLSRDPLEMAEINEGLNLFGYVRNNPINLRDPLGLCCEAEKAQLLACEAMLKDSCSGKSTAADCTACANNKARSSGFPNACCVINSAANVAACAAGRLHVDIDLAVYIACKAKPCNSCKK